MRLEFLAQFREQGTTAIQDDALEDYRELEHAYLPPKEEEIIA
ncbi:MAG: hypothetical protein AAFV33_08265 [Chloroflexota bacterium]